MLAFALTEWSRGKRSAGFHASIVTSTTHQKYIKSLDLIDGEMIVCGDVLNRKSKPELRHVCWVRTKQNEILGCYRDGENGVFELTLQMCQTIWPNLQTRDILCNEQLLSTGTTIPIVPQKFFVYKLHHNEKARLERASRTDASVSTNQLERAATNASHDSPPPTDDATPILLASLPTKDERDSSLPPAIPCGLLRAETTSPPPLPTHDPDVRIPIPLADGAVLRASPMWHILWQARRQIYDHPTYHNMLLTNPFDSVQTLGDLPHLTMSYNGVDVPLSKELIRWFHHFFPIESTHPES